MQSAMGITSLILSQYTSRREPARADVGPMTIRAQAELLGTLQVTGHWSRSLRQRRSG